MDFVLNKLRRKNGYKDMEDSDNGNSSRQRRGSDDKEQLPKPTGSKNEIQDTFTVDEAVSAIGFGRFQIKLEAMTGLCWIADSMELMILSIISRALHCIWRLSPGQEALITTVAFGGATIGAVFFGNVADKDGRKKSLVLSSAFLFYFGLLSGFSPTFVWLLIFRGLVGFTIGAVVQVSTISAEFFPTKYRGFGVSVLYIFWALGALFEVFLAWLVMPSLNWRWLLWLSSIPAFLFICSCAWLPESANFQLACGQSNKALATLKIIAESNRKPMLMGTLIGDGAQAQKRGRIKDLYHKDLWYTTLLLNFIWFATTFCYYGVILMSTEMLAAGQDLGTPQMLACQANCKELTKEDYISLLWTTSAEFPGFLIAFLGIEKLGRKGTMAFECFMFTGVCCALFFYSIESRTVLTFILFSGRGLSVGLFQVVTVYTPEVYPTPVRSVGIGACSAMGRIGSMVSPFVSQVLLKVSLPLAVSVYGVVAAVAGVASLLLPIETKGRPLQDLAQ